MKGAKYNTMDKVTLIMTSEFGEQFDEWQSPYATITHIERSKHKGESIIWCNIKTASGYTNSYPEKDLLPYFAGKFGVTNKQARVLLEDN